MNNVKAWHDLLAQKDIKGIDKLLDKHAAFYSPLVFKPQEGRKLVALYLSKAYEMFFSNGNESFKYIREIHSDSDSLLEFTCMVDEVEINGIDLIKWSDDGKIQEFKVMIRPYKAIEKVKEKMGELMSNLSTMDKLKMTASVMLDKVKK